MAHNIYQAVWDMFVYDETVSPEDLRFKGLSMLLGLARIPTYVLCLSVDDYEIMPVESKQVVSAAMELTIKRVLCGADYALVFAHQKCFYLNGHLSDVMTGGDESGIYDHALKELADRIRILACEEGLTSLTVGIGFHICPSMANWRRSAQCAITAQRLKYFEGRNKTYLSVIEGKGIEFSPSYLEAKGNLLKAIGMGARDDAEQYVSVIVDKIFVNSLWRLFNIRIQFTELAVLMARTAVDRGVSDAEAFQLLTDLLADINHLYDPVDLSNAFYGAATVFAEKVQTSNENSSCATIGRVRRIIDNRISTTISLKDISCEASVSYSYLSRLFKRELGISFTEYLNRERVKNSQYLLLDSNKNITEIALTVGFSGLEQFERAFKQICGVTPSRYRALNTLGSSLEKGEVRR